MPNWIKVSVPALGSGKLNFMVEYLEHPTDMLSELHSWLYVDWTMSLLDWCATYLYTPV